MNKNKIMETMLRHFTVKEVCVDYASLIDYLDKICHHAIN